MVQYSTKIIFAVLDVSLIMGLNFRETDKVCYINVGTKSNGYPSVQGGFGFGSQNNIN